MASPGVLALFASQKKNSVLVSVVVPDFLSACLYKLILTIINIFWIMMDCKLLSIFIIVEQNLINLIVSHIIFVVVHKDTTRG